MIVTVEEAKTKRCQEGYAASNGTTTNPDATLTFSKPFATMSASSVYASAQADQGPTAPFFCLGPACMAWRWREDDISGTRPSTTHGYCGKAHR